MRFFAINGCEDLGRRVAEAGELTMDPSEFRDFADGEHKGRPLASVRNEDVFVLSYLHGDKSLSVNDRLCRLLFFLATCRENGAARITVLVPYLIYARKDRQTKSWDPVTSKYLAKLFEAVGTDGIATIAVHNLSAYQNAFRCPTLHVDTAELFAGAILEKSSGGKLAVVSPDAGGVKRAQLLREALIEQGGGDVTFGFMEKRRSADVVTGDLFAGDVAGRDVWIIDDMIVSGGTMLRAANACRARNARSLNFAAAHALFDTSIASKLRDGPVDKILVSDTVPLARDISEQLGEKLEIVSCAPTFAGTIARFRRDVSDGPHK